MKKIIMLDRLGNNFSLEAGEFEKAGAEFIVTYFKNEDELTDIVKYADVVMFNDADINEKVINKMEFCKMIIRYGIGYDNVDLHAAAEKGIYVCNAPSYGTFDVAEHAMALLLAVCKKIPLSDTCARTGQWDAGRIGKVRRLKDKTIGFVGFGRIARCVCERTNAFKMKPVVFDPYVDFDIIEEMGAEKVSFDELLTRSDYITLHSPLTYDTKHMMGMPEFKKMKKDAVLINTSRGGLVNESELVYALLTKEIAGAALDVFEEEPVNPASQLLKMENVVLTPHVAWNSYEGVADLHREVTENVLRFLKGEKPLNIVNGLN